MPTTSCTYLRTRSCMHTYMHAHDQLHVPVHKVSRSVQESVSRCAYLRHAHTRMDMGMLRTCIVHVHSAYARVSL